MKILKYGTGEPIPEGAVYLTTLKQTDDGKGNPCWFVWHYFLIAI